MGIQNILLLVAGLINLLMSVIVFSRGIKTKINLYFGLLTFSNFFWAGSLFLSRLAILGNWFFWASFTYVAAIGIVMSLYYFSIFFPIRTKLTKTILNYFVLLVGIVFSIIIFIDNLFFIEHSRDVYPYILYYNNLSYILYSLFFIFLSLMAVYNFLCKYKSLEFIFKKQIGLLLIFIIIGLAFGIYFDLILCYFGNFKYNWLGPVFTLPMNFIVFYFIFLANKYKRLL